MSQQDQDRDAFLAAQREELLRRFSSPQPTSLTISAFHEPTGETVTVTFEAWPLECRTPDEWTVVTLYSNGCMVTRKKGRE